MTRLKTCQELEALLADAYGRASEYNVDPWALIEELQEKLLTLAVKEGESRVKVVLLAKPLAVQEPPAASYQRMVAILKSKGYRLGGMCKK